MRALQLTTARTPPEIVTLPDPVPGPGQALIRVTAAGLCHSDLMLLGMPAGMLARNGIRLPLTLGHEIAGTVVTAPTLAPGTPVAVYGAWGCGTCRTCRSGRENYCPTPPRPPGLGSPGGLAEYVTADERHLIPTGDLTPTQAAPLTDAAVTAYHAITRCRPALTEGASAMVIGAGGLGHLAIQLLRATTAATITAIDPNPHARTLATALGAHHTAPHPTTQADAILDFVGTQETLDAAAAAIRPDGHITIIGIARGTIPTGYDTPTRGATISTVHWGTHDDLRAVVALAQQGKIHTTAHTYALADAPAAYAALRANSFTGRAVVLPTH